MTSSDSLILAIAWRVLRLAGNSKPDGSLPMHGVEQIIGEHADGMSAGIRVGDRDLEAPIGQHPGFACPMRTSGVMPAVRDDLLQENWNRRPHLCWGGLVTARALAS